MAFVQSLSIVLRDKQVGPRCVPIVADEARTFGMEGMFRQIGIYAPYGQKYKPVDARPADVLPRRRSRPGAARKASPKPARSRSWMAAATSYSTNDLPMLPFYIYYSMFGFQRIGDAAWQAADMRARGFLLGATAGRTTLNGEGLQHEDGHSHLLAGAIPNCRAYDPTFAVRSRGDPATRHAPHARRAGGRVLLPHPDERELRPPGHARRRGRRHHQGHVSVARTAGGATAKKGETCACSCSAAAPSCAKSIAAAELLDKDFGVSADIWSCPSFTELRRDGFDVERHNRLNPEAQTPRKAYVTALLEGRQGPAIAATDYVRAYADQIRAFMPMHLHRARHRRLRPLGHARQPAPPFRSRPLLHRPRRHCGAGRGRQDDRARTSRARSSSTRSMWRSRIRLGSDRSSAL